MSEAVVFGIYRQGNQTLAGCGFLIDAYTLVTCAHVINTALGRDNKKETRKPVESEKFEVSHLNTQNGYKGTASIQYWALTDDYSPCNDIAILKLSQPFEADLFQDLLALELWHNEKFRAYGKTRDGEGWVTGTLMGVVTDGLIQIEAESVKTLSAGYSGTPVFAAHTHSRHQLIGFAVAIDAKYEEVAKIIPIENLVSLWNEAWGRLITIKPSTLKRKFDGPSHLLDNDDIPVLYRSKTLNRFNETLKLVQDFDEKYKLRSFDQPEPSIDSCLQMCKTIENDNFTDYIGQEINVVSLQVRAVIQSKNVPDDIVRKLIIYFRQYVEISLLISVYDALEKDNRHESTKDQWLASLKDVDQYNYSQDLLNSTEDTITWRQIRTRHEKMCAILNKYILTLKNLPKDYKKIIEQFNTDFELNTNDVLTELKSIIQTKKEKMLLSFDNVKNKVLHADEIDELIETICNDMLPNPSQVTMQREEIRRKADAILALRPKTDKSKITLNAH